MAQTVQLDVHPQQGFATGVACGLCTATVSVDGSLRPTLWLHTATEVLFDSNDFTEVRQEPDSWLKVFPTH